MLQGPGHHPCPAQLSGQGRGQAEVGMGQAAHPHQRGPLGTSDPLLPGSPQLRADEVKRQFRCSAASETSSVLLHLLSGTADPFSFGSFVTISLLPLNCF